MKLLYLLFLFIITLVLPIFADEALESISFNNDSSDDDIFYYGELRNKPLPPARKEPPEENRLTEEAIMKLSLKDGKTESEKTYNFHPKWKNVPLLNNQKAYRSTSSTESSINAAITPPQILNTPKKRKLKDIIAQEVYVGNSNNK